MSDVQNPVFSTLVEFGNYLLSEERMASVENPSSLHEVTDADISNFNLSKLKNHTIKFVKYGTNHCAMCKSMTTVIEQAIKYLKDQYGVEAKLVEVDAETDEGNTEFEKVGGRSIPYTIMYADDQLYLYAWNRYYPINEVKDTIDSIINNTSWIF